MTGRLPYDAPRATAGRAPWRRSAPVAALAAGAVLAIAGCGPSRSQGAVHDTTSTTTVGPVRTVRIGLLGTGAGADLAVEDGARLALNPSGRGSGGVDLIVVTATTGGTEAGAAAGARRLVADHVAAVIGPQTTAEVLGAEPVLSAAGIPSVTVTATSASFPEAGWSGFFRTVADTEQQGILVADQVVRGHGAQQVAVLSSAPVPQRAVATAAAAEVGVDGGTVALQRNRVTVATVGSVADTVVTSGATGVVASVPPAVAAELVESLTAAGYQGTTVLATQGSPADLAVAAADGGAHTWVASPSDDLAIEAAPSEPSLVFEDSYRAAFGVDPRAWAAQAYDAATMLLQAVASGATRPADIQAYLGANTLPGVASSLSFAASGDVADPSEYLSQDLSGLLRQTGRES